MSNNDNDMGPGEDGFDTDLGFEDGQQGAKKRSPLLKIVAIGGGLVAVVVAILMFGGTGPATNQNSAVAPAPVDDKSLPAQKEPTPQYREAMEQYNSEIIQKANETGTSAIPIPVDPARKQIVTTVEENQEDPAERFRQIQEEYRRQQDEQQQQQQGVQVEADQAARKKAVDQTAQNMSAYMSTVLNGRRIASMNDISITFIDPADAENAAGGGTGTGVDPAQDPANPQVMKGKMLLPATTIEYGQLLLEANTDAPGPVLALMVTGKLAGSRLLGSFSKTEDYLTLNFNMLITKGGKSIPISAIALDPDTSLPGVITEIDRKYFQRVIIPAAAEFISGVGSAIAETQETTTQSTTSTTSDTEEPDFSEAIAQGIEDSFDGIADTLEEDAGRTEPMLRVAAGTPIGILFTQEVLEPVEQLAGQPAPVEQPQQQNPFTAMGPLQFIPAYGFPTAGTTPAATAPAAPPAR